MLRIYLNVLGERAYVSVSCVMVARDNVISSRRRYRTLIRAPRKTHKYRLSTLLDGLRIKASERATHAQTQRENIHK